MGEEIFDVLLGYIPSYEKLVELEHKINQLERCVKSALDYRPLPTDPYQEFVRKVCPQVLAEWEDSHGK